MAMIERDVVLVGKDANGNTTVDLPITRLGNLEDTAETKSMPVSGDALAIVDSEADGEVKKISWSDVVNAVKDAVGGGDGSALEELKRALTEHEEDPDKHVAADDRAAWNNAKEKLEAHAADDVIHVTAQEREKWNNAGGGDAAKVGDILYSSRRDLGEKWALCNGDLVDPEEYPELDAVLPEDGQYMDPEHTRSFGGENSPAHVAYRDGYWVGFRTVDGEQRLSYAKTPEGPWHDTKLVGDLLVRTDSYAESAQWGPPEKIGPYWVCVSGIEKYVGYELMTFVATEGDLIDGEWERSPINDSPFIKSPQWLGGRWVIVTSDSNGWCYINTFKNNVLEGSTLQRKLSEQNYTYKIRAVDCVCWGEKTYAINARDSGEMRITEITFGEDNYPNFSSARTVYVENGGERQMNCIIKISGDKVLMYGNKATIVISLEALLAKENGDTYEITEDGGVVVDQSEWITEVVTSSYVNYCRIKEKHLGNGEVRYQLIFLDDIGSNYAESATIDGVFEVVTKRAGEYYDEERAGNYVVLGGTNQYYTTQKALPELTVGYNSAYIRVKP